MKNQKKGSANNALSTPTITQNKMHLILAVIACIVLPFIIYSNSLHAPFVYDDGVYIVENPRIKSLFDNKAENYEQVQKEVKKIEIFRTITFFTFSLNYHFGKLNPFGYHLFNLAIHILNVILIFFLTREFLFAMLNFSKEIPNIFLIPPLMAALIFSSHPINTEVVTYASHRSESLAAMFYLLSLLFFLKTVEGKRIFYLFSLISFTISYFCKETSVTLPLLILITDFLFFSKSSIKTILKKIKFHIPYWFLLIIFISLRYFYFSGIKDYSQTTFYRWNQLSYLSVQPMVILKYIKLLLFPYNQCIDHFILPFQKTVILNILFPTSIMIGAIIIFYFFLRKNIESKKLFIFSLLWFFITLLPTSALPIFDAMAERRTYLPEFGFTLFILSIYLRSNVNESIKPKIHKLFFIFVSIYILFLSISTWKRNIKYQNPVLLWKDVIAMYPQNDRAHYNLGVIQKEQNEHYKAQESFRKAIELNPNNFSALYNLGLWHYQNKEYQQAKIYFQKAIQMNPGLSAAYSNLGLILTMEKKYSEAIELFQKAINLNPLDAISYQNAGSIFYNLKNYEKALELFQKSVEIAPNFMQVYFNMGLIYIAKKEYDKAIFSFNKVIEIDPTDVDAYSSIAMIYYEKKEYEKSIDILKKAKSIFPNSQSINQNLNMLLKLKS